jgi:hypothetical protein
MLPWHAMHSTDNCKPLHVFLDSVQTVADTVVVDASGLDSASVGF